MPCSVCCLVSLGLVLCNGNALVAATIVASAVPLVQVLVLGLPFSAWELPLLGVVAALPAAAAVALGLRTGAALWDRLDASREMLHQTTQGEDGASWLTSRTPRPQMRSMNQPVAFPTARTPRWLHAAAWSGGDVSGRCPRSAPYSK
jgi:hypothetical protein